MDSSLDPTSSGLSRRQFIGRAVAGASLAGSIGAWNSASAAPGAATSADTQPTPAGDPLRLVGNPRWYERAWRRAVIDMHIADWDDAFLSKFDPDDYVDRLRTSRAQSIVCYAHSHVGLFNYPTQVGQAHRGLKGRDIVAEMIERCHRHNIAVILYASLIYDRWAADHHADWRMRTASGDFLSSGGRDRHGLVCPNSPYREYVRSWVRELCERYRFEGVRFDMTYWPGICHCAHCQQRWAQEVGGEWPRVVDWFDPRWMAFARKRDAWLGEFAQLCTDTVRRHQSGATVEHQASTFPHSWVRGASWPLLAQNDFLQGDFYGDALQGSFVRKMLEDLTPHRPFGYETSFSLSLYDHTGKKSEALLEAKASAAIADAAAFIFIDAIDPIGTVNPHTHARMGRVFDRLQPYYAELGGQRVADVGLYYSLDSKFDPKQNGRPLTQADLSADVHTGTAMQAARWLIAEHLPVGVVTKKSLLEKLPATRVLVLPNVQVMDEDEASAIRAWVEAGGHLYASGACGLIEPRGALRDHFPLSDVLGVTLSEANWSDREHYVAPTEAGRTLLAGWDATYPAFVKGPTLDVMLRPGATVLATRTLPWPAREPRSFSSIHSDPPWQSTDRPEVVVNAFGRGRAIYAASCLESVEGLAPAFIQLIRHLEKQFTYEVLAHPVIEATLFHQPDRSRYLMNLVNFQKDLPNLPVENLQVTLRLPQAVRAILRVPDAQALPHTTDGRLVRFTVPRVETFAMFAIQI